MSVDKTYQVAWQRKKNQATEHSAPMSQDAAMTLAYATRATNRRVWILHEHDQTINKGKFFLHLIIK